jgi:hypothetical protein
MLIDLHRGNILDVKADTLVLPVDGSGPGLEGNIARQLMKRLVIEAMHELYAPPPYYPYNGSCYWSGIIAGYDETHFNNTCCLGFLSHAPGANVKGYMVSAFGEMLSHAGMDPGFAQTIACPVLTGGHRLNYVDAVYLMLAEIERTDGCGHTLTIVERDPEKFEILKGIVRL